MKKYLLTALLGVFGLFGFTNATSYTFEGTLQDHDGVYSPNTLTLSDNLVINASSITNYVCDLSSEDVFSCRIIFGDNDCIIDFYDGNEDLFIQGTDGEYCELTAGTYNVSGYGNPFNSITISDSSSSGGSDSSSSPLLSGGTTVFSGIISSLGSAVSEFIPYVAYIGLGLLGAIIGFVAIKRLINRVRAKIFGTFSGGRRR